MFTGLIQTVGRVRALEKREDGARLTISTDQWTDLARGESIAVSGVCLTVFPETGAFHADLSHETLTRTTLGRLIPGAAVNLERALTLGDRLGGHLVQGHVDATGRLERIDRTEDFATYRWSFPESFEGLVVDKGSIAVDGISLTIVEPRNLTFSVALIPETLRRTTLGTAVEGDEVNLEFDMMAKYARHLLSAYLPGQRS